MGRGGGTSSSGGTSGGGRGFSSHRSSAGSSRGMSSSRGGSRSTPPPKISRSTPPPPKPPRSAPPPPRPPRRTPPPRSSWGAPPPPRSSWGAPPPRPPRGYRPQSDYGRAGRGTSGCGIGALIIVAVIVVIIMGSVNVVKTLTRRAATSERPAIEKTHYDDNSKNQIVDSQSTPREKLEADACVRTDQVLEDALAWLSDTDSVEQAMEDFYDKTGVQLYLLICETLDGKGGEITDGEAENYLKTFYDSLYDDEGHMIFVFMEYEESEYVTFLYTGRDAERVMDEEAREVFLNYADRYYTDSSLSDEEYFAKIFRDSADSIMQK